MAAHQASEHPVTSWSIDTEITQWGLPASMSPAGSSTESACSSCTISKRGCRPCRHPPFGSDANDRVLAARQDLGVAAPRPSCQHGSVARVDDRSSTAPLQWSRRGWGWQRAHSEIDTGAETAPVGNCAQDQRGNSSQCDTINALEAFGNRRTTTRAATGPSREKKSKKRTEVK